MKYGYFDDNKKEYIITDPRTPMPWINYIGGLDFGGFVDQLGGGVICKGDPAINRITKYIPQLPASDMNAETLYIRFKDGDKYRNFSAFYTPTLDNYDLYECHVGLGYSTIISEFYGIRTEVTIFIPKNSKRVIRKILVKNISKQALEIDVIPVIEYTHFDAMKQFNNADWIPQTMQSRILNKEAELIVLGQYAFMQKNIGMNYLTSNYPVSSFESDRAKFLGNRGYGSWKDPEALKESDLSNTEVNRGDNIGALLHKLGSIAPGESKTIITQLGQTADIENEMPEIQKFRKEKNVDAAFQELTDFWDNYLSVMQVNTPSAEFNSMINIHNPRQCYITRNWSRYLSLYQLGLGARGMGFRDSSQDVMAVIPFMGKDSKDFIKKLLSVQKRDGSAMHQFNPLTMIANQGDSREEEDRIHYYGDDHLWCILAACEYVKESGDISFLGEIVPFYDKTKERKPEERATVLDHLSRGIEFTHGNIGKNGLPLVGFADWNDSVNLPVGAESLFIANLYGTALKELIQLCEHINEKHLKDKCEHFYNEMKIRINEKAWDGQWYVRYFDHVGKPIGSNKNEYGKIYTNGQSWPVISGFAEEERSQIALDSVYKYLNTSKGIKLSYPGYDGYNREIGGVTSYPPGAKENGGIFLHSNPWVMIAETIIGNGNRAFEYYNQMNPAAKNGIIDEYEVEPYCYAQNILGDEHPQFGLGRNSWLSGTASWTYQAATKNILGICPDFNGLCIDPCIPKEWDGFSVTRVFRGSRYLIEVKNPEHVSKGVKSIKVDGKAIEGKIIPCQGEGKEHQVEVVMG